MLGESITLPEALEAAHKAGKRITVPTLISWIIKHNLGHQPNGKNGKWFIFKDEFLKFITGGHDGENIGKDKNECQINCEASCEKKPKGCGGKK